MSGKRILPILLLSFAACFHQVVQTGRPASQTVVDKPWVATWLWGLVPAKELDMRASCPSGVAVVETEQSFVNGLVAAVTLGIFTPQHVRVTCASRTASLPSHAINVVIAPNVTPAERADAFRDAVRESAENHTPVIVRF
jgi:Bor protein